VHSSTSGDNIILNCLRETALFQVLSRLYIILEKYVQEHYPGDLLRSWSQIGRLLF